MPTRKSYDDFIGQLDLSSLLYTLVQSKDGPHLPIDQARETVSWYKRFLYLVYLYPDEVIVPTTQIDTAWHYHILDTQKYFRDCDRLFGKYLHHFPYLGERGKDDQDVLNQAFEQSLSLFRRHFDGVHILGDENRDDAACGTACGSGDGDGVAACGSGGGACTQSWGDDLELALGSIDLVTRPVLASTP